MNHPVALVKGGMGAGIGNVSLTLQLSEISCAVPCCAGLGPAVLCCAVLCCAVLCCAVLCCAVPCCAVLCRAVLCCTALRCAVKPVLLTISHYGMF